MRARRTGSQGASRFGILAVVTATSLSMASVARAATIVNCIGEQTTITGEGVTGPTDLWPQQLGMMLGATYTVNNDGVNAGAVTAVPAMTSALNPASLVGPPNIVVIGPFAEHDYAAGITEATWQADYKKLVDAYLALTPAPTVYVMTPPPAAFTYQSAAEQTFATDVVKPAVLAVAAGGNAATKTLKVIDLFTDAALTTAAEMAGDGHLKPAGHKDVATLAYKCVAMGMCAGSSTTGTGGAGGGAGGAGGASGAAGAAGAGGAGGAGGATGAGGTTGAAGTTGAGGATTGTAGTGAGTTGAAGTGVLGAAGTGGTTTGTAGDSGTTTGAAGTGTTGTAGSGTTGAAGTGGTATGAAGTGSPARSSGGGCTVADTGAAGGLATLLLAMAFAARAARRRRS
jgi:hypothetical protein